jgi:hypothetical protein
MLAMSGDGTKGKKRGIVLTVVTCVVDGVVDGVVNGVVNGADGRILGWHSTQGTTLYMPW